MRLHRMSGAFAQSANRFLLPRCNNPPQRLVTAQKLRLLDFHRKSQNSGMFFEPENSRPLTTLATLFTTSQPQTTTFCAHSSPKPQQKRSFLHPHHTQKKSHKRNLQGCVILVTRSSLDVSDSAASAESHRDPESRDLPSRLRYIILF